MNVGELRRLISQLSAGNGKPPDSAIAELDDVLRSFDDVALEDFCRQLRRIKPPRKRKTAKARKKAQIDSAKTASFVAEYNRAIGSLASDEVSLDYLRRLSDRLKGREFNKDEVLVIAKECGISTAKSKKAAAERIQKKLLDLKTTLSKTRMYQ